MKPSKSTEIQLRRIKANGHEVEIINAHNLWHLVLDNDTYFFSSLKELEMFVWGFWSALPF